MGRNALVITLGMKASSAVRNARRAKKSLKDIDKGAKEAGNSIGEADTKTQSLVKSLAMVGGGVAVFAAVTAAVKAMVAEMEAVRQKQLEIARTSLTMQEGVLSPAAQFRMDPRDLTIAAGGIGADIGVKSPQWPSIASFIQGAQSSKLLGETGTIFKPDATIRPEAAAIINPLIGYMTATKSQEAAGSLPRVVRSIIGKGDVTSQSVYSALGKIHSAFGEASSISYGEALTAMSNLLPVIKATGSPDDVLAMWAGMTQVTGTAQDAASKVEQINRMLMGSYSSDFAKIIPDYDRLYKDDKGGLLRAFMTALNPIDDSISEAQRIETLRKSVDLPRRTTAGVNVMGALRDEIAVSRRRIAASTPGGTKRFIEEQLDQDIFVAAKAEAANQLKRLISEKTPGQKAAIEEYQVYATEEAKKRYFYGTRWVRKTYNLGSDDLAEEELLDQLQIDYSKKTGKTLYAATGITDIEYGKTGMPYFQRLKQRDLTFEEAIKRFPEIAEIMLQADPADRFKVQLPAGMTTTKLKSFLRGTGVFIGLQTRHAGGTDYREITTQSERFQGLALRAYHEGLVAKGQSMYVTQEEMDEFRRWIPELDLEGGGRPNNPPPGTRSGTDSRGRLQSMRPTSIFNIGVQYNNNSGRPYDQPTTADGRGGPQGAPTVE